MEDRSRARAAVAGSLNRRRHTAVVDTEILDFGTERGIGLMSALMKADGVITLLTETSMH